jgi:ATP-dependent DNA ligase
MLRGVAATARADATDARQPFHRPGWIYEEKYDGWRILTFTDGPRVRLISREAVDHTDRFRELARPSSPL